MTEFPERIEEIAAELNVNLTGTTFEEAIDMLRWWLANAKSEAEQYFSELEDEIDGFEDGDHEQVDHTDIATQGN